MAKQEKPEKALGVSPARAQELLGISRKLYDRLVAEGTIRVVKLGDRRKVVPMWLLKEIMANPKIISKTVSTVNVKQQIKPKPSKGKKTAT